MILAVCFAVLVSFTLSPVSEAKSKKGLTQDQLNVIRDSVSYDYKNEHFKFDIDNAVKNGFTIEEANNLNFFFTTTSLEEMKKLSNYQEPAHPTIAPALLVLLGFIGGGVASFLLDQILTYGVAKTCKKYYYKNAAFKDYCKTVGHI